MGKCKDQNNFDNGFVKIVKSRWLAKNIWSCVVSRYAVISIYQKWSKEEKPVKGGQGYGHPRLTEVHWSAWECHGKPVNCDDKKIYVQRSEIASNYL